MPSPLALQLQALFRAMPMPGVSRKAAGLLSHSGDIASAYLLRRALYLEDELDALLDESWLNEGLERLSTVRTLAGLSALFAAAGAPLYTQIAALESCWYMRNQLLRDTDWSSMAHGLEVRVPFVDISSPRSPWSSHGVRCATQQARPRGVCRRVAAIDAHAT